MNFTWDDQINAATIMLQSRSDSRTVFLTRDLVVGLAGDELVWVETLATADFGTPFDEAAAERAVAHARELLASPAAG